MATPDHLSVASLALFPHHVEHLIPLCELLDADLFVVDRGTADAADQYPYRRVVRLDLDQKSWAEVAFGQKLRGGLARYDAILISHLLKREELRAIFGSLRKDPPRIAFCPHGFSEKKQDWSAGAAYQDVSLFYGTYGIRQLEEWGVRGALEDFILIGNLRHTYYLRHRDSFSDSPLQARIRRREGKTNILYAPTWNDALQSTSFASAVQVLIANLPKNCRLIIKPHPLLEPTMEGMDFAGTGAKDDIVILRNSPMVYPVLEQMDAYIGDVSAIAYDFLLYDRPMLFLNEKAGTSADPAGAEIMQCGTVLPPDRYCEAYSALAAETALSSAKSSRRQRLYESVYQPGVDSVLLAKTLRELLACSPSAWLRYTKPTQTE